MSSNLINIGLSGLNAAQWGLTTTSENISNSTTPGYDVENPVYSESPGQYTGSGYLPQGVSTTTVQRAYSQYLTTELNTAQSQSGSLQHELHDAGAAEQHGRQPDLGYLQRDHHLFHAVCRTSQTALRASPRGRRR